VGSVRAARLTYEDEVKSWSWVMLGVLGRLGGVSSSS
jgi:hypothetical protein